MLKALALIQFAFFVLIPVCGEAQDCTLGIGGKDTELIIQVFQLNEEQQVALARLEGEYILLQKEYKDNVKILFDTHSQENATELLEMAEKFSALKEELVIASRSIDQKLLEIFNDRQYTRYIELCEEVQRRPMPRTQ